MQIQKYESLFKMHLDIISANHDCFCKTCSEIERSQPLYCRQNLSRQDETFVVDGEVIASTNMDLVQHHPDVFASKETLKIQDPHSYLNIKY